MTECMVRGLAEPAGLAEAPTDRFTDLFERLYGRLFGLAYSLVGDRQEAEDLVQEAFLRLADAPVRDRPDEEVLAWSRRVCLNLGANQLRSRRRAQDRLERVGRLELAGGGSGPGAAGEVARQAEAEEVREALARLPARQRDCLLLRHSGYSYAEIAATLEIAVGSVGVLLARAERAFRETYLRNAPRTNGAER
ncbi:MAG: sigma-70 family RNA polymerase sigma factor [Chloroflexi bacterium]|nr:sigma-70 family RNA polymerase sigma factor [Chloroflexota bacterium]